MGGACASERRHTYITVQKENENQDFHKNLREI